MSMEGGLWWVRHLQSITDYCKTLLHLQFKTPRSGRCDVAYSLHLLAGEVQWSSDGSVLIR